MLVVSVVKKSFRPVAKLFSSSNSFSRLLLFLVSFFFANWYDRQQGFLAGFICQMKFLACVQITYVSKSMAPMAGSLLDWLLCYSACQLFCGWHIFPLHHVWPVIYLVASVTISSISPWIKLGPQIFEILVRQGRGLAIIWRKGILRMGMTFSTVLGKENSLFRLKMIFLLCFS